VLEGGPAPAGSACAVAAGQAPCHGGEAWAAALAAVLRVSAAARRSGAAGGEALADVATRSLPLLLPDFLAAQLRVRAPPPAGGGDPAARARALRVARGELEGFVARALALRGLLPRDEARAVGLFAVLPHLDERGGEASAGAGAGAARADAGALRAAKVERFKRNRAADARRAALAAADAAAVETGRRRGLGDADAEEARAELDGVGAPRAAGAVDDDVRREIHVLTLQTAVRRALDDISAIDAELPLLAHAQRLAEAAAAASAGGARQAADGAAADARTAAGARGAAGAGAGAGADFSGRTGPPAGDLSTDPARPGLQVQHIDRRFNITRENVKADVFRDPLPPPTMAMEDWGDVVTAKRVEREAREKLQAEAAGKSLDTIHDEGLEDSVAEADYDRATVRKRNMDDWKDGHVKGAGNTKRV